ncbi:hypothetical protein ACHAWF_017331 [Thalassiosira exigua]
MTRPPPLLLAVRACAAPERWVYASFLLLWIAYGVLNQYHSLHGIEFDPAAVVWSQEGLKIVLSLLLFRLQDGGLRELSAQASEHRAMPLYYVVPAGMYALGDVLTYVNLRAFDPATLHLLGEMKLVVVAIVHQCLFGRMLTRGHWAALAMVTAGCVLKALDSQETADAAMAAAKLTATTTTMATVATVTTMVANATTLDYEDASVESEVEALAAAVPHPTLLNYCLVLVNILATTFAGVFNEKLLKDLPSASINLQNLCLYADGMIFLTLGLFLGLPGENKPIGEALSPAGLEALFSRPSVLAMAIVMSIAGLVTSRFLQMFDSIQKSVAVALVVVCLPVLGRAMFGTPVTAKMVVSIGMVVAGMRMYTSRPPPRETAECHGGGEVGGGEDDDWDLELEIKEGGDEDEEGPFLG